MVLLRTVCAVVVLLGCTHSQETNTSEKQQVNLLRNVDTLKPIVIDHRRQRPQSAGFDTVEIQSGPIVTINDTTLLIAGLRFVRGQRTAAFYTGTQCDTLQQTIEEPSYQKANVYVHLKSPLDAQNAQLCVIVEDTIIGEVEVNTTDLDNLDKIEKELFMLPKCCPNGMATNGSSCVENVAPINITMGVFSHNETYFDDDSLDVDDFQFEVYQFEGNCDVTFTLTNEDEFNLLRNGSLLYSVPTAKSGILPHGEFCLENWEESASTHILVCYHEKPVSAAVSDTIYVTLMGISTFCYAIVAILYYFVLFRKRDLHRRIFTIYALFMGLYSLMSVLLYCWPSVFCGNVAYVMQFLLFTSHVWLVVLCSDIVRQIYYVTEVEHKPNQRLIIYVLMVCSCGCIPILLSWYFFHKPNLPSGLIRVTNDYSCEIAESSIYLFTVPCAVCLLACFFFVIWLKLKIYWNGNDKKLEFNAEWLDKNKMFNFVCRSNFIIVVLMCVWPAIGVPEDYLIGHQIPLQILCSAQGIMILFLSCLYREMRHVIVRRLRRKKPPPIIIPSVYERNQELEELFTPQINTAIKN